MLSRNAESDPLVAYGSASVRATRTQLTPDPVIEYYKKDVDRALLREQLKLTPQQRLGKLVAP